MNLHTASQVSASFEENKDSFLCIHFSCGSKKRSPFPASPWGRRAPAQCCGWGRGLERASQPRADRRQVVRNWIWMSSGREASGNKEPGLISLLTLSPFVGGKKNSDSQALVCSPTPEEVARQPPPLWPRGAGSPFQAATGSRLGHLARTQNPAGINSCWMSNLEMTSNK